MAAQYDALGNYLGDFETEEERRKREEEEANAIAQKIEVKTYGDGRQVKTTTQQLPPGGAQAFPVPDRTVPGIQVAGPVSPDTFSRMIQAESGGRQFTPSRQVLTSPKGAMGVAQIMPSTAMQPGYGVPNIFDLAESQGIRVGARDEATAKQLLANEQLNRLFGQNYANAMRQQFGTDQAMGAAYNAGPGTVQRNMAANQGQLNVSQLPGETQGYLDRVFRGAGQAITNMFPSAQAGTLPPGQAQRPPTVTAPVAPETRPAINPETGETYQQLVPVAPGAAPAAEPSSMYSLGTGQSGLGFQGPGGITANGPSVTGVPMTTISAMNSYQAAQDDLGELIKMRNDNNMPDFIRQRAGQRAYEILDKDLKDKQFTEYIRKLADDAKNPETARQASNTFARELQNKDASPFKYWFFKLIGQPEAAAEEAVKLGMGSKWTQGYNEEGRPAMIKVDARGMPLQGFDDNGNEIASNKLVSYMIGGKAGVKSDVSTQDVEKNGQAGRVVTQHLPNGMTKTMVESGGKLYPYDTSWKPRSIQTAYDKRQQELNLKLQYVGPEAVAKIVAEDEAKYGPLDPQVKAAILQRANTAAPQVGGGAQTTAGTTATTGTATTTGTTATTGTATTTGTTATTGTAADVQRRIESGGGTGLPTDAAGQYPGQRRENREVTEAGRKEIIKKAGDIVASSDKLVGDIISAERAAQDALTKKNNFGTLIHGMIPGEQAVGELFKTQDHINTMNVLDVVNKVAASNAKMLGANPTDRDLQFVTSTKPDINWSPEAVADWLRRSAEGTRRTLDFARKQIETGGRFVPETPQENKETPTKRLSREDQQAVEWARRNPDDPRAAEIKRRLGL